MLSFDREAFIAASTLGPDQLLDFYRERVVW